ncbi:MAG: MFS transporter [Candidatus Njordarchaeia archaeon]
MDDIKEEKVNNMDNSLNWKLTFVIGLGFFTTGITWTLYNSYVPIFLRDIILGSPEWYAVLGTWMNLFIGIVMILDNIAAITLQPWIGAKSDKTWTRFGRRMPYLMVGIPIAAFFFVFIPIIKDLIILLLIITCFNIAMAVYRAPVVALMPDLIPSKHRSKANGVINLMGGVGAVYAFLIGAMIYKTQGPFYTFLYTSIIMVIALLILMLTIREPEVPFGAEESEKVGIVEAFREVLMDEDKSGLFILLAILFWFLSYNVIETWFTTYGKVVLGVNEADASMALTGFALMFILAAIPAGYIATKIGRKNTIMMGLIGLMAVLIVAIPIRNLMILALLLTIAGIFWALININSIVMVWEIGGSSKLGAYTGLYYFFSSLAAIVGPSVAGLIFDITGHGIMFIISVLYLIVAILFMSKVRKGEYHGEE